MDIPTNMDHAEFFKVDDMMERQDYISLMRGCLQYEPYKRPTLTEIRDALGALEMKEESMEISMGVFLYNKSF